MKVARFTVRRPVFTTMAVLIVLIIGGVSLARLPIDLMPEMESPTITVATNYGNASPEEVEEAITRPIERAVAAVPGVQQLESVSNEGGSQIRVRFAWGTDMDVASNDIRDRLDRIVRSLPDDADRPQLRKFDAAAFPILILGIASDLDPVELRTLIDEQFQYRLERVDGVAAVDIWGGLSRQIQINLDLGKIQALDLPFDQIINTIRESNISLPAGAIDQGRLELTIRTPGHLTDLDQLRGMVVAIREGAPIHLIDIADVVDTHEEVQRVVRINGRPGMRLAVRKQSGSNTVDVAERVLQEVDRLNAEHPYVDLIAIIDTSKYIRQSIDNVSRSILYGGGLAILVLLFFLRNIRSTLIIATAIPIAIVATFAMIYFGGFTLNLMTLGGLALGVGMMVDNAIVVLENIYRNREEDDLAPNDAAVTGTEQVTAAIIASTITTLVIFLPLVFIQGQSGKLFEQLGYVVSFSLIASLLVALTLIPMLASRLLRPVGSSGLARKGPVHALLNTSERAFRAIESSYGNLLETCINLRWLVLLLATGLFAACLWLVPLIGAEFMPPTDEGEVRVNLEMEVGTRLEVLDAKMREVEDIISREVPEVRAFVMSAGGSSFRAQPAAGSINISLVPLAERTRSSEDIAADLRQKLAHVSGVVIRTRAGQGLLFRRLGGAGPTGVELEIRGFDLQTLDAIANEVSQIMESIDGVTDVQLSRESGVPQRLMEINRQLAADQGVTVRDVARALETGLSGTRAGIFRDEGLEVNILIRLKDARRLSIDDLLDLKITNNRGEPIALRNVIPTPRDERGPIQILRRDQQRITSVTANISGRDMISVIREAEQRLRDIPLPRNYSIIFAGDYEEQQEAFTELMISLILSLVLVYMVMACLYESLLDPLIVMFSVPLAAIGVLLMLFLTDTTLNVQSFIGCIMLGGIVVNNAILIVDQTNALRAEGRGVRDALAEAGRRRLRPILMTSLTTMLGLVPLALGWGEGAEAQAPMARAVIGGLFSSTMITLVVIPAIYAIVHRERPATS